MKYPFQNLVFKSLVAASIVLSIVACNDKNVEEIKPTPSAAPASDYSATDKWLGQWNGPEGTFLKLSGGEGKYEVIIQNLDGPKTYSGISLDNRIQFERNGVLERIRASNGEETGMKWLSEKQNCLTINRGEGFCKD
jgi:hypothetical protein